MRGRAYRRFQREQHIKRKENFLRKSRTDNPPHKYNDSDLFGVIDFSKRKDSSYEGYWLPYWFVADRGRLNKGKIHCSCGMCATKTRNKGKKRRVKGGNWYPYINYKHSDLKKINSMQDEVEEFENYHLKK